VSLATKDATTVGTSTSMVYFHLSSGFATVEMRSNNPKLTIGGMILDSSSCQS